jgi:hypothetical protein
MTESPNEIRDSLPDDLNVTAFVGPYMFPDNSRRRIPAILYLAISLGCFVLWFTQHTNQNGLVTAPTLRLFLFRLSRLLMVGSLSDAPRKSSGFVSPKLSNVPN